MKKKSKKTVTKKPVKKAAKKKTVKKSPAKKSSKKVTKKVVKKTSKKLVAKKSRGKKVKQVVAKKALKKSAKSTKSVKKAATKPIKKTVTKVKNKANNSVKSPKAAPFKAYQSSLKVGNKAPHFEGIDQNGNSVSLNAYIGKKVILYFYPKDDTPGCTATACSLRDEYQFLNQKNYVVIGVSADDKNSHAKFAAKYDLPFPLIADTDKTIIKAYDVWGKKMFMGKIYDGIIRTTFVISETGILEHVIHTVNTGSHAQQILAL